MKLEVGMYVRTKKGKIYKFDTNNSMAKNGAKKYMVNCSYNLIDLIKVGDYVNGDRVTQVTSRYVEVCYGRDSCDFINEEDIKSIVTKEQFESMKYSLEGNNEYKLFKK